ncbi:MAG: hypothetical protein KJ906_03470 [Nanoarchaeota archaeon]|nr:hypothetical protein [Nanoarchaeota archaeon]
MIITIRHDRYVDFKIPPWASEEQTKKIIKYMEQNFPGIKRREVDEPPRYTGEKGETTSKKWTPKDIVLLFSDLSNEEIANKLKRSKASIDLTRGAKTTEIIAWAKKNGKKMPIGINTIKECMEAKHK